MLANKWRTFGSYLNIGTSICYRDLFVILISVYGLYLRFMNLARRELWTDEIYQFNCIKTATKHIWIYQNYGDHTSFPGEYMLGYPFVHVFGLNKWGLAIPHIIITAVSFYLLFKVCQRYFKTTPAYLIAFIIVSLNRNLVFHSFEFRPYGVLSFLAIGNLYFSDFVIRRYEKLNSFQKFGIAIFFVFSMSYHAYGVLIVLLPMLFSCLFNYKKFKNLLIRKDFLKFFVISMLIALAIWCWYAARNNFGMTSTRGQSIRPTFQYIVNPAVDLNEFFKMIIGNLMGFKPKGFLLIGLAALCFFPNSSMKYQVFFLFILVILPIALILAVDIKTSYWFIQRQFVWVVPFFAVLIGWCWDSIIYYLYVRINGRTIKRE